MITASSQTCTQYQAGTVKACNALGLPSALIKDANNGTFQCEVTECCASKSMWMSYQTLNRVTEVPTLCQQGSRTFYALSWLEKM